MRIECVRTHWLRAPLSQRLGFSQCFIDAREVLWVEIITSDGTSGWGECYGPAAVCQAAVDSLYAPRLVGENPLAHERLWHRLWRETLDFARGGILMAAISGLDIALWDLKGKLLGLPVSELLGGRQSDSVAGYATGMYFRDLPEDALIEVLVEEAIGYYENGFGALKIKIGKNWAFDSRLIVAMREALPEAMLMADANHAYELSEAVGTAKLLEQCRYVWFEEPLSPEYEWQFRQLSERTDIPLAAGECEQTRHGFRRLLSPGGVQIAQPDLAYCGGITEGLKIRALASSHGVNVVPHCWGTLWNLAAASHFVASGFWEPGRLESPAPLLEVDRSPNPLRDELFAAGVEIDGSRVKVPTASGLGVVADEQAMMDFRVNRTEVR